MKRIHRLAQAAPLRRLNRGDLIYRQGDEADAIFVLSAGWATLVRLADDGKEMSFGLCEPGEVFGGLEILLEVPRMTCARVVTLRARVVEIKQRGLEAAAEDDEELIPELVAIELGRLARTTGRLADMLATRSVHQKLSMAIAAYPAGTVLPISHEVLATLCGIAREETTRVLGFLESSGVVSRRPGEIRIDRPELLADLIIPGPSILRALLGKNSRDLGRSLQKESAN